MASSKITTTLTLTLSLCLNLLLLSTTHAWTPYTPSVPSGGGGGGSSSTPSAPSGGGGGGSSGGPSVPSGGGGGASRGTCPIDALKLGVCANLLGNLLNLQIGTPPVQPCCSLIQGLADLEAAVCLCTVIRANVLNLINLNLPVNLSLLLNVCSRQAPRGFICP